MPDVDIKKERVPSTSDEGQAVRAQELTAAYNAAVSGTEHEHNNQLLIHACHCDNADCQDPDFHRLCSHMKRFLRVVCWASHSAQWRAYPIATVVIELFTFHALHCHALECHVPMCRQLRDHE